jgi:fructose-1,6-bisphosphatase II
MDRNLALDAVRVTEAAALASARTMGRGDLPASHHAAVRSMRRALNSIEIRGRIVIGEGERDEVPELFVGEKVGRGQDQDSAVDLAVDPLEGTNLCARIASNAMSVLAIAKDGRFLPTPDTYMYKIAVGPAGKGAIDLSRSPQWNLQSVADAKGVYVEDLTVVILDRPRHEALLREVRDTGARIKLISDGDLPAAISTCLETTAVDMLIGTGGAPEGVIAAAAVRSIGGDMLCQFRPRNQEDVERIRRAGITDMDRIYRADELASGDVIFAATAVTDGDFLRGVRFSRGSAKTHSMVVRSKTSTIRMIEATHSFLGKRELELGG